MKHHEQIVDPVHAAVPVHDATRRIGAHARGSHVVPPGVQLGRERHVGLVPQPIRKSDATQVGDAELFPQEQVKRADTDLVEIGKGPMEVGASHTQAVPVSTERDP